MEQTKVVDLGKLSAEAVQTQYELAAKAVEELGVAVRERIARLQAALEECDSDLKLLADAAAHIRDKGNLVYAQIDEASALSSEIRTTVSDFKTKLGVNGKRPMRTDLEQQLLDEINGMK